MTACVEQQQQQHAMPHHGGGWSYGDGRTTPRPLYSSSSSYGLQKKPRLAPPPKRWGCGRCLQCCNTAARSAPGLRTFSGEEFQEYWPFGLQSPTMYYYVCNRQLVRAFWNAARNPQGHWRPLAELYVPPTAPSALRQRRQLPALVVNVPAAFTNVREDEMHVEYMGAVAVPLLKRGTTHHWLAAPKAEPTRPATPPPVLPLQHAAPAAAALHRSPPGGHLIAPAVLLTALHAEGPTLAAPLPCQAPCGLVMVAAPRLQQQQPTLSLLPTQGSSMGPCSRASSGRSPASSLTSPSDSEYGFGSCHSMELEVQAKGAAAPAPALAAPVPSGGRWQQMLASLAGSARFMVHHSPRSVV